jgi:hypothetical protein
MAPRIRGRSSRVTMSETEKPTPGPGDVDASAAETASSSSVPPPPAPGAPDEAPTTASAPLGEGPPLPASAPAPWYADARDKATKLASERPELPVGAAFAGGLFLALVLKRLGR